MRARITPALLTVGLGLVWLTASVPAQDEEPVYRKVSPRQFERILRDLNLDFEKLPVIKRDDIEINRWQLTIDGYNVLLLTDGSDLQLRAGFDAKLSLARVNEWNREKRWGRAYVIEGNKGVSLEADLDFKGGVSLNGIKEFVKLYRQLLKEFAKLIKEEQGGLAPGEE